MPAEQQLVVAGAEDATVAVAEQGAVGVSANVGCFSLSLSLSLPPSLARSLAASLFLSLSLPLFRLSHTYHSDSHSLSHTPFYLSDYPSLSLSLWLSKR